MAPTYMLTREQIEAVALECDCPATEATVRAHIKVNGAYMGFYADMDRFADEGTGAWGETAQDAVDGLIEKRCM